MEGEEEEDHQRLIDSFFTIKSNRKQQACDYRPSSSDQLNIEYPSSTKRLNLPKTKTTTTITIDSSLPSPLPSPSSSSSRIITSPKRRRIRRSTSTNQTDTTDLTSPTTITSKSKSSSTVSPSHRILAIPRRPKESRAQKTYPPNSISSSVRSSRNNQSPFDNGDQSTPQKNKPSDSPPPLPPPLDFTLIESDLSTRRSTLTLGSRATTPLGGRTSSLAGSKCSTIDPKSVSVYQKKPSIRKPRSPIAPIQPHPDNVLVPDSSDSPQNFDADDSCLESKILMGDQQPDPVPKRLFKSPTPPISSPSRRASSKFFGCPSTKSSKTADIDHNNQNQSLLQKSSSSILNQDPVNSEEQDRQRLLADLGFNEEPPQQVEPLALSSSPIEIIQSAKKATKRQTKKIAVNETTPIVTLNQRKPRPTDSVSHGLSEWEDEHTILTIDLSDSASSPFKPRSPCQSKTTNRLGSQVDQMRDIGIVIDEEDGEKGNCSNSGIAPLMSAWPASKRHIFMKMAGLKPRESGGESSQGDRSKDIEEWDELLLNKGKKSRGEIGPSFKFPSSSKRASATASRGKATRVKKAWHGRSTWRTRKKGSKAFKGVGRSTTRRQTTLT